VTEAPLFEAADTGAIGAGVAEAALARLDQQAIYGALSLLARDQRLAIVLMDLAGLTASEAAEALGCPRNTVLSWVHRGRKRLATLLVEQDLSRDVS
jgi:RNA polymerase sigma-70 factor (ECF subfamily)